jgi:endoglycosylceramidase
LPAPHFIIIIPLALKHHFKTALFLLLIGFTAKGQIKDPFGRTIILHGLNTAGGAKHIPGHQPWITEADVNREYANFGFNAVRYLIFWGAIEPEKDVYDTLYLQEVKKRVEWYTSRKMYVVLDMHQDVYGYGVGGNGAPEWASTQTKTQNLIPDKWPWWMQNLEPKVKRSYVEFFKYKNKKDLQDHYIKAWLKVVDLLKDNPYVIGYDLMNEPHGGKIVKTLSGGFERKWLGNFYKRLIPAIRAVDTTRYIFFEPRSFGVNFGMKSHLKKVNDVSVNKLVYAPHCYMKFVDVGGDYKNKDKRALGKWFKRRDAEAAKHQSPILIGEYGLSPSKKGFDKYLQDMLNMADARGASWAYWASDPGGWGPLDGNKNPSPILYQILRPYPWAVSGKILSYQTNTATRVFDMEFINDTTIVENTIIAVPRELFSNDYKVIVTGTTNYSGHVDIASNAYYLSVGEHNVKVRVQIYPVSNSKNY